MMMSAALSLKPVAAPQLLQTKRWVACSPDMLHSTTTTCRCCNSLERRSRHHACHRRSRVQQRRALTTRALFGKGGDDNVSAPGQPSGPLGSAAPLSSPATPRRPCLAAVPACAMQGGGGMPNPFGNMGNLMDNLKKAQQLVQVEAAKVQDELAR